MSLQQDVSKPMANALPQRARIVQALAEFRKEWQVVAQDRSLLDVEVPIGLVLSDIAEYLELGPQERHVILGDILAKQIDAFRNEPIHVKLSS